MRKAELHGLRVLCTDRELYREHGNVDDKLYNPRAGWGSCIAWLPAIWPRCAQTAKCAAIHISALERIAHGTEDYAPR